MSRFNRRCILFIMVLLLGFAMTSCKRTNVRSIGEAEADDTFDLQKIKINQMFVRVEYALQQAKEAVLEDILVYDIEMKEDINQKQPDYAQAYIDIINEYETEFPECRKYDMIYLDDDDVPELVADMNGYYVSVFTYDNGIVYTLMDDMGYGSHGCVGYEYLPRQNVVYCRYLEQGIIAHDWYMTVGNDHELYDYYEEDLSILSFQDKNENGRMDEDEDFEGFNYCFYGNNEITEEEYDTYMIQGDYEYIYGTKTAEEIIGELQ